MATTTSETRCFGGVQKTIQHASDATGTDMNVSIFLPPQAAEGPVPVLYYLSGLTCTEENVTGQGRRPALRRGSRPRPRHARHEPPRPRPAGGARRLGLRERRRLLRERDRGALERPLPDVRLRDGGAPAARRRERTDRRRSVRDHRHSMGGHGPRDRPPQPGPLRLDLRLRADRLADPLPLGPQGPRPLPRRRPRDLGGLRRLAARGEAPPERDPDRPGSRRRVPRRTAEPELFEAACEASGPGAHAASPGRLRPQLLLPSPRSSATTSPTRRARSDCVRRRRQASFASASRLASASAAMSQRRGASRPIASP